MTENVATTLLKLVLRFLGEVDNNSFSLLGGFIAVAGYGLWCWFKRDWTALRNLLCVVGGVLVAISLLLFLLPP